MARPPSIDEELDDVQLVLNVKSVGLTDDQFAELCSENNRPGGAVEEIEAPGILRGDPILPGFEFNFSEILHVPE